MHVDISSLEGNYNTLVGQVLGRRPRLRLTAADVPQDGTPPLPCPRVQPGKRVSRRASADVSTAQLSSDSGRTTVMPSVAPLATLQWPKQSRIMATSLSSRPCTPERLAVCDLVQHPGLDAAVTSHPFVRFCRVKLAYIKVRVARPAIMLHSPRLRARPGGGLLHRRHSRLHFPRSFLGRRCV